MCASQGSPRCICTKFRCVTRKPDAGEPISLQNLLERIVSEMKKKCLGVCSGHGTLHRTKRYKNLRRCQELDPANCTHITGHYETFYERCIFSRLSGVTQLHVIHKKSDTPDNRRAKKHRSSKCAWRPVVHVCSASDLTPKNAQHFADEWIRGDER